MPAVLIISSALLSCQPGAKDELVVCTLAGLSHLKVTSILCVIPITATARAAQFRLQ